MDTEPKPKIWCLFSIAQEYDQPDNNLVAWWQEKPSIEKLANFLACPMDKARDEDVVAIVEIWKGERADLSREDVTYRLECVEEGGVS
jgi:hypothetical protein